MEPRLSKYLAGIRKNHNTQHAFLKMMLNKGNKVGAIAMDLSKAFNKLYKLKAYGFDTSALTFIQSYFSNRH